MIQKKEQNYYQLLGINPGVTDQEIKDAYRHAKKAYASDSVATYSLFSSKDKEAQLKKIITAYETLKEPSKRKAYDEQQNLFQDSYEDPLALSDEESLPSDTWDIDSEKKDNIEAVHKADETFKVDKLKRVVKFKYSLPVVDEKNAIVAEQFRVLYTKLMEVNTGRFHKTFAVTSAVKGEGKTMTSLNLSYMMAQEFKKKVVLVECDLRRPSILSHFMDSVEKCGIENVITGKINLYDAICKVGNSSLYLLPAGKSVKNPSELLETAYMKSILNNLKDDFDYIIVDTPPILSLADMNILSKIVDGLIVVVRAGKTPRDVVLKAVNSLSLGNIVGIVLNGEDISHKKYSNYYYYSQ